MSENLSRRSLYIITTVVTVVLLLLDQVTKAWTVKTYGAPGAEADDLGPVVLRLVYNPGAAFSLPITVPAFFIVVALIFTAVVLYTLPRVETRLLAGAIGLVLGGAWGNVIDRIFRSQGVVDMIDLDFWPLAWFPVFNVADIGITVGTAVVVLALWRADVEERRNAPVLEDIEEHHEQKTSVDGESESK